MMLAMSVYPRLCGGTLFVVPGQSLPRGLSPPVRGNPAAVAAAAAQLRSIPACAGEPAGALAEADVEKVYPRLCGGTAGQPVYLHNGIGLSPPVRGNLRPDEHVPGAAGSIPACAGEPDPIPSVK